MNYITAGKYLKYLIQPIPFVFKTPLLFARAPIEQIEDLK